jgi:hypothetical protein
MEMRNKSVLIEIPEDAYKQNSVYRPWNEIGQTPSQGRIPNRLDNSATPTAENPARRELPLTLTPMRGAKQHRKTAP